MAWEPQISQRLHAAFDSENIHGFQQLLRDHPAYLRRENGADYWMWKAAMAGRLRVIEALVDLGLDVNETHDHGDPTNPFYQPEGPILQAATNGDLANVRWLLEHGARINYVIQGGLRCLPLIHAASGGHLDVVRLLVEHGADFDATWRGLNAATQAEDLGHFAVRDYLRSLGARTLRETTPPDFGQAHAQFLHEVTEQRGPLADWHFEIDGDPLVTIRLIPANEKCDVQTLFTVGLSDHPLPEGPKESACTELRCILPASWLLSDPCHQWPKEWLDRIVRDLRATPRLPEKPFVMNGDPPAPLSANTRLSGWLFLKALGESVQAAEYRWIDIHSVFPIYAEELTLLREFGLQELINRLQAFNISLYIDPNRPNVAFTPR